MKAVLEHQAVRHGHAVGLHRVPLAVVKLSDVGVVEIRHLAGRNREGGLAIGASGGIAGP